ncbi:MAG: dUTP diphosphatase [Desulfovibrionaceae bacterium]|nr:dUTP diphosphatase [Desulfovibrionaceae bacterium]
MSLPSTVEIHIRYLRDAKQRYGSRGLHYATPHSAGLDIRFCPLPEEEDSVTIFPGSRAALHSGIAVAPCSDDTAGFLFSRSGLGAIKGLTVAQGVGVIDPDYRGEIIVMLLNTSAEPVQIRAGERIAQIVFQPVQRIIPVETTELDDTERGMGGFGHTGK